MPILTEPEAARDPRVTRSRAAILQATAELLIETGFAGVTIEGVAERAGVAKTTIYRHWRTRSQLIFDAFASLMEPSAPRLTSGNLRADLIYALRGLIRGLTVSGWAPAVSALIEAGDRDPELSRLVHDFLVQRMAPFHHAMEEAVDRGELAKDVDIDASLNMLTGPIYYRRLVSREPLAESFAERVVDQFLRGAASRMEQSGDD